MTGHEDQSPIEADALTVRDALPDEAEAIRKRTREAYSEYLEASALFWQR
ncbi:MAG: hypothetical protein ACR2JC_18220 [Chloroflexota bacterium]